MRGNLAWAILLGSLLLLASFCLGADSTWTTRTGVPDNGYEEAVAIAVDDSGNVYVTGHSSGGKEGYDFATIKYGANGDTIWTKKFDGVNQADDRAVSLALPSDGSVYVAGSTQAIESRKQKSVAITIMDSSGNKVGQQTFKERDLDIAIIKYSDKGELQWMNTYKGAAKEMFRNDKPSKIIAGAEGGVLVSGATEGEGSDIATYKLRYREYFERVLEYYEKVFKLVKSSLRELLAGDKEEIGGDFDYLTLCYSALGQLEWAKSYSGSSSGPDFIYDIVQDYRGNVIVTGAEGTYGSGADFVTLKYSPKGDLLWSARYNGPRGMVDMAKSISVDKEGFVYVTGESQGKASSLDYATIKYNPDGTALWTKRYDGPAGGVDSPVDIAVDKSGDVFVTGTSQGESFDFATVRYRYTGDLAWVARYDGPGKGMDKASAMAIDDNGNVYVTGRSLGDGTGFDFATVKYSPSGDTVWVRRFDGQKNGGADGANAIAVDKAGNVYVTGTSWGGESFYDYLAVKYSPSGEVLWARRYSSTAK